jgi:hypothetical protein
VDVVVAEAGQDGAALTVKEEFTDAPGQGRGDLGDHSAADAHVADFGPAEISTAQQEAGAWAGWGHAAARA